MLPRAARRASARAVVAAAVLGAAALTYAAPWTPWSGAPASAPDRATTTPARSSVLARHDGRPAHAQVLAAPGLGSALDTVTDPAHDAHDGRRPTPSPLGFPASTALTTGVAIALVVIAGAGRVRRRARWLPCGLRAPPTTCFA